MLLGSSNAFVVPSPNSRCSKSSSLNYFDDVSRHSIEWQPPNQETDREVRLFQAQKLASIKRRILGHDAISASHMSRKEVKQFTRAWAHKTGVVAASSNRLPTDEEAMYKTLTGMTVCRNTDILGCLAYYWRRIVKVMRDDEHSKDTSSFVYMMVFPYCKALYYYEKFQWLNMAVHLGQPSECSLTMFHPKYKNAPTIFSPERHSPFPTAGLVKKKQDGEVYLDDSVFLDQQRVSLERLFNSAAATTDDSSSNAVVNDTTEHLYRPAHEVVDISRSWFDEATRDRVDDRWFVSDATLVEEAYADVYTVIHDLYLLGLDTPKGDTIGAVVIAPRFCSYNAPQWRHFCITVNAVLKKLGKGKMRVEFYHAEYTKDPARQSPFSTIQIVHKA